jgi:hypothetical protein
VDETTDYEGLYRVARAAVLAPDRTAPLMFHTELPGGRAGLSTLSPDGSQTEPVLLYEIEDYRPLPNLIATVAADGKVLAYGYLFMPADAE